jgi:hypothetical protein
VRQLGDVTGRRAVIDVAGRGDRSANTRLDRPDDLDDSLTSMDQRIDPSPAREPWSKALRGCR